MLLIFHVYLSHLIIPIGRIHFVPHFTILTSFAVTILSKSIVGADKYVLKD